MVLIQSRDGYYCANAIGTDLTAWDNGQVKLAVGELNAIDWFLMADITPNRPKSFRTNPMTAGMIEKRLKAGYTDGVLATTHNLQTGILTYAVMGACSTAGAGDPYTHTISKATNDTPISLAFHYEKEGTNSSPRWDFMGFIPRSLDIYVSETSPIATQMYNGMFAYTKQTADDLAQPTAFTQAALRPYTWFDYKNSSGASSFLYNTGAINVDITDLHIHLGWLGFEFGAFDGSGYRTDGWVTPPFDCYVDVIARRKDAAGTDIDDIVKLGPAGYAGDLDFIADFYIGANDYLKYTWDKVFIPEDSFVESFPDEKTWREKVKFRLEFEDEDSSVAVEEKNNLAATYYENT